MTALTCRDVAGSLLVAVVGAACSGGGSDTLSKAQVVLAPYQFTWICDFRRGNLVNHRLSLASSSPRPD